MYIHILFKSCSTNNDRLNEKLPPPQKKTKKIKNKNPQLMYKQVYVYKVYRKEPFTLTLAKVIYHLSLLCVIRYTLPSPAVARDRCCYYTNFIAVPPSVKAIAQVDRVVTT